MPLFDTLSGLDIHVKIQVTPDRVITKDISTEFEGKLKDMVNNVLKKTVSLQVRDMFVMYMPNKQKNEKMYYLFDMYLYNSTGKIKFSQAIAEVKWFFTGIKSQELTKLSNGINIVLRIGFAHKIKQGTRGTIVDMSSGKSLTVIEKTAWRQRTPRPELEITNVHWCYRTGVSFTEVKLLGRRVFEIPSNPPVIVYETEVEEDPINHMIYICIDLVVPPAGMIPILSNKGNVDINNNNEANEAFDRGATMVVSCLVFALLGFIFCKIRVHVCAAKTNTDIPSNQTMIEMDRFNNQSERRKDDQSEQSKDDQSEQSKDDQSEQRKDTQSEQSKDDQPEQSKDDQSEQSKSEQSKDDQSEQSKDDQSEQRKDTQSEQSKDDQSEQSKGDQYEQNKDDQSEQS